MSTLETVLKKPAYTSLSDEEARAALLVNVDVPKASILYTMSGVGDAFALAGIDQSILLDIGGFIKSLIGGPSLYDFLMSAGCDFTITAIQQQLAYNAYVEAANATRLAAVNVLIGLGSPVSTPQWEIEELSEEPTLEGITAARSAIVEQEESASFIATIRNEILNPAESDGKTKSEIVALLLSAIEAS